MDQPIVLFLVIRFIFVVVVISMSVCSVKLFDRLKTSANRWRGPIVSSAWFLALSLCSVPILLFDNHDMRTRGEVALFIEAFSMFVALIVGSAFARAAK